jgi:predicted nucleic acid-binding Zn ribbon protein
MRQLSCNHCNNIVKSGEKICTSCGMPLPTKQQASPQRKFIYWFIFVVIFSFAMMVLLPWFGSTPVLGQ